MSTLKDSILSAIQEERVQMRSSFYFRVRGVLLVVAGILLFAMLVYVGSFLHFVWHATGAGVLLQFGWTGFSALVSGIPWLLVATLLLLCLFVLGFLVQVTPSYRRPRVWILLGVILATILGSAAIRHVPLHERWHRISEAQDWPFVETLYHYHHVHVQRNFTVGIVKAVDDQGLTIELGGERTAVVIFSDTTQFPGGRTFAVGQRVGVLGDRDKRPLQARGVVTISNAEVGQWYDDCCTE